MDGACSNGNTAPAAHAALFPGAALFPAPPDAGQRMNGSSSGSRAARPMYALSHIKQTRQRPRPPVFSQGPVFPRQRAGSCTRYPPIHHVGATCSRIASYVQAWRRRSEWQVMGWWGACKKSSQK